MALTEYGEAIIRYDSPDNLVDLWELSVKKFANNLFMGQKDTSGKYIWNTYAEIGLRITNLRSGLATLNLQKDDCLGIIANNRKEWFIAESAAHGLLCRWVPMYEKELADIWRYIIEDAAIKVLFVANQMIYDQVKVFKDEISTLEYIFVIDGSGPNSMQALEEKGAHHVVPTKKPKSEDIAVLIYTSGTTGDPKGVLLSHGNLTACSQAGYHIFPSLIASSRSLSMLPWAHSYGISAELHNFIQFGGSIGIMESVQTLSDDLAAVQPTHLITVPRVFNKIYNGLWAKMEEEGGLKFTLFKAAVAAAKQKMQTGKAGFKFNLLDKIVLAKIREKLGGKLELSMTASAKMDPEIAEFFFSIGIPCYDCYGMTETSPAITMNCPGNYKIGTVGKPVEKTKLVIDHSRVEDNSKEGEILIFGPQVMQGYHNKPDKTAEIIIEQNGIRGVRTGDRGWIDDEGYLYVTGRFKEEYKLLNGKYVHPAAIEQNIKLIPWVANCMVYGDGKEYNTCLVVPDFTLLHTVAHEMDLSLPPEELVKNNLLQELIKLEIQNHLKGKFGKYEIPRKFMIVEEDFTLENAMLTQTMKLKRRAILKKYQDQIEALYN